VKCWPIPCLTVTLVDLPSSLDDIDRTVGRGDCDAWTSAQSINISVKLPHGVQVDQSTQPASHTVKVRFGEIPFLLRPRPFQSATIGSSCQQVEMSGHTIARMQRHTVISYFVSDLVHAGSFEYFQDRPNECTVHSLFSTTTQILFWTSGDLQ
jgi:hypothetical protein